MVIAIVGVAGGIIGLIGFMLGLFDRPKFEYEISLVNNEKQNYLYTIVAVSTENNFGGHIERLMQGVLEGITKTIPDYETRLKNATRLYSGSNSDPDAMLSVGLYFDDPTTVSQPRWSAGWAIQGDNVGDESYYEELNKYVHDIQKNSGLQEPIRIVRVGRGGSTVLKGHIPVRCQISPMISPMIQWTRAYKTMKDGGYKVRHNTIAERSQSPGLAVFFINKNNSVTKLDYNVLMGDVTNTWDDCFPPEL